MLRLLASTVLELAVGLLIAAWILPRFSIDDVSFVVVVAIFTVLRFIFAPLIMKLSLQYVRALAGGIALVTTFVGLFLTTLLTDGLVIDGIDTWVLATLIVWLAGVIASLILPLFIFRQVFADAKAQRSPPAPLG